MCNNQWDWPFIPNKRISKQEKGIKFISQNQWPNTRYDLEKNELTGCFECCIASILGLEAGSVPFFETEEDVNNNDNYSWYNRFKDWCSKNNYELSIYCPDNIFFPKDDYYILTCDVKNHSGFMSSHSVIGYNGNIVFDPSPSPYRDDQFVKFCDIFFLKPKKIGKNL